MKIIDVVIFAFVCITILSCKNDKHITDSDTWELRGNVFFQPVYVSDLAPGLWAVNVDNSTASLRLLGAGMWYPRISHDGSTIVAVTTAGDTNYVNVLSSTGQAQRHFSLGEWRYVHFLDPSPDGSRIVVSTSKGPAGSPAVAVVNRDGTSFFVLNDTTRGPSGWPREAMFPTWSPDGSRIAYVKYYTYTDSTKMVLLTINPDGSDSVALCETYGLTVPLWSPDGGTIACFQNPRIYFDVGPFVIRVVDVNSRTSREIVLATNVLNTPNKTMAWAQDGTLYCSAASPDSDGIHAIYRVSLVGSPTVQQIAAGFLQSSLVCSPDGKHIGILGNKGSDPFSLYVMKPDGSNLQLLKKLSNNAASGTSGFIFSFWI